MLCLVTSVRKFPPLLNLHSAHIVCVTENCDLVGVTVQSIYWAYHTNLPDPPLLLCAKLDDARLDNFL